MSSYSADFGSHITEASHARDRSKHISNNDGHSSEGPKEPDSLIQSLLSSKNNVNGMKSDTRYLAIAFVVVLLPLILISIMLVTLLLRYRIRHNQIVFPEFQASIEVDEPGVYYTTI